MRHAPDRPLPGRRYQPGDPERPALEVRPAPLERAAWRRHADLAYGIDLYEAGYAWEAHEVWEASWQVTPEGPERELLRGLIQRAAAAVQDALDKPEGAARLRERAAGHLARAAVRPIFCGVEVGAAGGGPLRWLRRGRDMPGTFTELAVQPLQCTFEVIEGAVVQRCPAFRDYYGGHAVYAEAPVRAADLPAWRRRTGEILGGASTGPQFRNLLWETEELGAPPPLELDEGDELQELHVLWADAGDVAAPPLPPGIEVRRLVSDADWDAACAWSADNGAIEWGEGAREYAVWRQLAYRTSAEVLGGGTFAAFSGGELIAGLGLIDTGRYLRYQSVQTSEPYRRRGIASHLVGEALRRVAPGGDRRAVIVAEAGSDAERIYRRLGFVHASTQRALRWLANAEPSNGAGVTP